MNYDNTKHKIRTIWNQAHTVENDVVIEQYKIDDISDRIDLPIELNAKRIYQIDSDWQDMEITIQNITNISSTGVVTSQYPYYRYYYKDFELILMDFPLRFIPYINFALIYKHIDVETTDLDLRVDKIGHIYQVYNMNDEDDFWNVSRTVNLRAGIVLRNYGDTNIAYDVKAKLLVEISNQKFMK